MGSSKVVAMLFVTMIVLFAGSTVVVHVADAAQADALEDCVSDAMHMGATRASAEAVCEVAIRRGDIP
ncbi:hypothetical protein F511_31446 [Dorcoceras hygrometricum]|uniref:Uncharacterized protein n=1 Tax=Dorcoceras hygrometricum TaxID=472368 RepID=A0A2Z7B421_9LAMI|nr:hypothetical protein F511_31446 [Dorcoceras hygrometricum]